MNEKSCPLAVPPLLLLLSLVPGCFDPAASTAAASTGSADAGTSDPTVDEDSTSGTGGTDLPQGDASANAESSSGDSAPGSSTSGEGASTDDSGESTGGGQSGDPPTGAETGSAAPPMIVEISPEDGALGVRADHVITIRFSEAMDKAATQAAYQSSDIPASAATFSWNEAGDELRVTPNQALSYAQGTDDASTDALTYAFTISGAAEAESGVSLEDEASVSFSTLRRLSLSFTQDTELSGRVRDLGGAALLAGTYGLGDTSINDVGRGFVSFDVSSVPDGELTVEEAALHAEFSQVQGNPFVDLGAVVYQHVSYDAFDDALFDTAAMGSASALFATVNDDEVDRDVTSIAADVLEDPASFEQRVQFKMQWIFNETDGDSQADGITILAGASRLDLQLLAP